MALPATHLRIAADLADRYPIQSGRQYYSGALYPDSRWLTGVDRRVSHSQACGLPDFIEDDFSLGWYVHCRCDRIQAEVFLEVFPDVAELDENSRWRRLSVLKMLQDREDMTEFDLAATLAHLTCVQSPNGENPQGVKAYLDLVRDTYSGKKRLAMDDYHGLWIGVGLAPQQAALIMAQTRRLAEDKDLIRQLRGIYPQILARF